MSAADPATLAAIQRATKRCLAETDRVCALLGDEFFIASPATHPNYPISFGVLGLKGSEFVSKVAKDRSFRMPIGVDLFVLDEIADDPGRFRAHWGMRALRVNEAELFPARSVPFEDITVRIPAAYDVVLTRGYGDYMRIPDPEDRVTHEPFHIVFGPNDPWPEATEEAGA